ncbi:MAG: FtsX-like permease family protein [Acidobacteria bacterium]|nr:FtsX-like permease family protein [Acidobacteriota bacterium]
MRWWTRISNTLRGQRLDREIDEELESHLEEAARQGRDTAEARRAFGSALRLREQSHEARAITWIESAAADFVFGWRQLRKSRNASAAAILSLALATGACTAVFRLIDAVLLRPMPVADPGNLYVAAYTYTTFDGSIDRGHGSEYPAFVRMRDAVPEAELLAISYATRIGVRFNGGPEGERQFLQYVSGNTFLSFGLKPALGRLIAPADDLKPGAHPVAVISHDYWIRQFGGDPGVLGRTFHWNGTPVEVIGVAPEGFTGTETGSMTDIFMPVMMNAKAIGNPSWVWHRIWVRARPGSDLRVVRDKLRAAFHSFRREQVRSWPGSTPQQRIDEFVGAELVLEPAGAGVSGLQRHYHRPLMIIAVLAVMVLLIACANVANLLTARAAARAREMALRVSIGAGRGRLVRLVFAESLLIAVAASGLGALLGWWGAPLVVRMVSTPDSPVGLVLPFDYRVAAFSALLTLMVSVLFGLAPALRASAVEPAAALKGGDSSRGRRRSMSAMVAFQVAFCFAVFSTACTFTASLRYLLQRPLGFAPDRLLLLETVSAETVRFDVWLQAIPHIRAVPGVESAAFSSWPLLGASAWRDGVRTARAGLEASPAPYFLSVSPGWFETMRIPLREGRDFRPGDVFPGPAVVDSTFARRYFGEGSPLGQFFEKPATRDQWRRFDVAGVVGPVLYENIREPFLPVAYVPINAPAGQAGPAAPGWGTFVVRTAGSDPLALAPLLRQEIRRARPELRVTSVRTQEELIRTQTVRERMLAASSAFFAAVALLLAAVGLYGVLEYAVVRQRREIGIRMALGAQAADVAGRVSAEVAAMLAFGSLAGFGLSLLSGRFASSLVHGAGAGDPLMLGIPAMAIVVASALAAVPPLLRALRIAPAVTLRAD